MPLIHLPAALLRQMQEQAETAGQTLEEWLESRLSSPAISAAPEADSPPATDSPGPVDAAGAPPGPADPLLAYLRTPAFRALHTGADRYLQLLAWIHRLNPRDFRDFVDHLPSRRKYFGLSEEEVRQTSRHNQARQIPDSPYWAILNLDTATKRRFLRRAMEFSGLPDAVIVSACATLQEKS